MMVDKTSTESYLQNMDDMKNEKIDSFWDLLSILKKHPDWLEELRKLVLTDELLLLPKKFDEFVKRYERFVENDFKPLKSTVEKQGQDIAVLKEDVGVLKEDVGVLKTDVGDLKGDNYERKVRENAPSYFGRLIVKCKLMEKLELAHMLDEALDKGIINDDERDDALLCDVVVTGVLRRDRDKKVVLAAEVSVVADKADAERAAKRSKIIEKIVGLPGIPVVIGKDITEGGRKTADELQVVII